MRILWHSNAANAPTGYGNQTALFTPRLKEVGHEVIISAFYGREGAPVANQHGILELPRRNHPFGVDVLPAHYQSHQADMLLTLVDPISLDSPTMQPLNWAAWCPVDSVPDKWGNAAALQRARYVIAMSKFGMEQLHAFDPLYLPHGIDTQTYQPGDRRQARQVLSQHIGHALDDKFLVVDMAANKGVPSRKNFSGLMMAFAEFSRTHPDAVLYLHTDAVSPIGENLRRMAEGYGIEVFFPDAYLYNMGMLPPDFLNSVYNAADVFLHPALGEGFGIPAVEAQAAGCPVIMTDATAMSELNFGGWKLPAIPVSHTFMGHGAEGSHLFLPLHPQIVSALEDAYGERHSEQRRLAAREGALAYDINYVFSTYMQPILAQFEADLNTPPFRRRSSQHKKRSAPQRVGSVIDSATRISIVTPWLDAPELIADYERSVHDAAEVIIVDNGSSPENLSALQAMVDRLGGYLLPNAENVGFSAANNQGLAVATGDIVLFLNNDIYAADGWLKMVIEDVAERALCGPSIGSRQVSNVILPYIEGYCIAARRAVWDELGGWPDMPGLYWEDNLLCWRALRAGIHLLQCDWPVEHLGNYTSQQIPNVAYQQSAANQQVFEAQVLAEM